MPDTQEKADKPHGYQLYGSSSPARTDDPAVNSRMLCHISGKTSNLKGMYHREENHYLLITARSSAAVLSPKN